MRALPKPNTPNAEPQTLDSKKHIALHPTFLRARAWRSQRVRESDRSAEKKANTAG